MGHGRRTKSPSIKPMSRVSTTRVRCGTPYPLTSFYSHSIRHRIFDPCRDHRWSFRLTDKALPSCGKTSGSFIRLRTVSATSVGIPRRTNVSSAGEDQAMSLPTHFHKLVKLCRLRKKNRILPLGKRLRHSFARRLPNRPQALRDRHRLPPIRQRACTCAQAIRQVPIAHRGRPLGAPQIARRQIRRRASTNAEPLSPMNGISRPDLGRFSPSPVASIAQGNSPVAGAPSKSVLSLRTPIGQTDGGHGVCVRGGIPDRLAAVARSSLILEVFGKTAFSESRRFRKEDERKIRPPRSDAILSFRSSSPQCRSTLLADAHRGAAITSVPVESHLSSQQCLPNAGLGTLLVAPGPDCPPTPS